MGKRVTLVHQGRAVIWSGPVGAIRPKVLQSGIQAIAHAVAACKGFTLAGGGENIAAIEKFHVGRNQDTHDSPGVLSKDRGCPDSFHLSNHRVVDVGAAPSLIDYRLEGAGNWVFQSELRAGIGVMP